MQGPYYDLAPNRSGRPVETASASGHLTGVGKSQCHEMIQSAPNTMLFYAQYVTSPAEFLDPGQEFERVDLFFEDLGFRLVLRTREWKDPDNDPYIDILIASALASEPEAEVAQLFECRNQLKPGSESRDEFGWQDLSFDRANFSEEYWDFMKRTTTRLDEETASALGVLFWRAGIRGGPSQMRSSVHRLFWQPGDDPLSVELDSLRSWRHPPHGFIIFSESSPNVLSAFEEEHEDVVRARNQGKCSPLGQGLLQEAWRLAETNPRSSLVTGVAAAETRMKELIVDLEPATLWLIENIQSPPLDKLTTRFLPTLDTRLKINGKSVSPQGRMKRNLKRAVELRNKIVHGRGDYLDRDTVVELLASISDFNYMCDYYSGEDWALARISEEARKELERA